jgi:hypothetical protein
MVFSGAGAFDQIRQLKPCIRWLRSHFRQGDVHESRAFRVIVAEWPTAGAAEPITPHRDPIGNRCSAVIAASRCGRTSLMTNDPSPALSPSEFESLREISKGDAQQEIPQFHWERLVSLGYAIRRLGELGLTASGARRLAAGE